MKQQFLSFARAAAASVVMIWLAVPLNATVVATYADRALWEASLTAIQTADFNETMTQGGDLYQNYSNATGYTDPSNILNFLGKYQTTYDLFRTTVGGARLLRGPQFLGGIQDARLEINLLSATARGFGVSISSSIAGVAYSIFVDGTEVVPTVPVVAGSTPVFIGFTTDSAFSQIIIRAVGVANGTESYFDDASIGQALAEEPPPSEAPEPSTLIFLLSGGGLLAWTRFRRPASQLS